MQCIYCTHPTNGKEDDAHIFPEAIIANTGILLSGMVCNSCNQYLGDLDNALIHDPFYSFAIQNMGLPGKKGKPRKKLGMFERPEANVLRIHIPPNILQRIPSKRNAIEFRGKLSLPDKTYWKVRRELYHIAFNVLASQRTNAEMLAPELDPVRKYIRYPQPKEQWPYGERFITQKKTSPFDWEVWLTNDYILVRIRILDKEFFVEFLQRTILQKVIEQHVDSEGIILK